MTYEAAQITQGDTITAARVSLSFLEQNGEQAIHAAEEQLDDLRSDLLYYTSQAGSDLARVEAERDELRRLLRQCLPFVRYAATTHRLTDEEQYDVDQLVDLIETSAPEPEPAPFSATDDDMPEEVPF